MPTLDTAHLFQSTNFSDITLYFADSQVPCHKLVLCNASEFFKLMFGPNAQFAEKDKKEIVLKDDEPNALMAVLRYIYTNSYVDDQDRSRDWQFHLQTSAAAKKYQVEVLEDIAYEKFQTIVSTTTEMDFILDIIVGLPAFGDHCENALETVNKLRNRHLPELYKLSAFSNLLDNDSQMMRSCLDYAVGKLPSIDPLEAPESPEPESSEDYAEFGPWSRTSTKSKKAKQRYSKGY